MDRLCKISGEPFKVTDRDLAFYHRLGVPPPTLCPPERMRRRLSFRNESSLHRRQCDGSGEQIVSMYAPDSPFPVYENSYWWGDSWDGKHYAQEFSFERPFFEQFGELLNVVPKMARVQQGENVNSKWCNCASYNKNCYLIFSSSNNEDCMYCRATRSSRDCLDCYNVHQCELCYECLHCENCYSCLFSENSKNCSDSWFLKHCIGCSHCFGCINLRNKSYHFFNEPLSKQEYERRCQELACGSYEILTEVAARYLAWEQPFPVPYYYGVNNEHVSGNYISNSKNAFTCYDIKDVEDCSYCDTAILLKNCQDVSYYGATGSNELVFECEGIGHGNYEVVASKLIWGGSSSVYHSYECFASHHLLGCAGLKHAEYCIFNKQYTKEGYAQQFQKIRAHMLNTGEWGEFFPPALTPHGYNETLAHEHFPLTKNQALALGYRWRDPAPLAEIPRVELPDNIAQVTEKLLTQTLSCQRTRKPYRIERKEFVFYQKNNLPLPRLCPEERAKDRFAKLPPRTLISRTCASCGTVIESTYTEARRRNVLCLQCYQRSVGN